MTVVSAVSALTSPWPADAGFFVSPARRRRQRLRDRASLRIQRHYACCATPGCAESIYSDGGAWRHTRTSVYQCPSGAGWAQPYDPEDVDALIDEQRREWDDEAQASAEQAERNGYDEGYTEGHTVGITQGRQNMFAEIDDAIAAVFNTVSVVGPGATAADAKHALRAAIAAALSELTP